ncbi:hypothetical protein NK718_05930 [Alsobacter sp. SYSU M60028]|uniref:DUF6968 domain-containing protein n=1 Tax=Alsobacter ponti TaxID=2962936 RepID=A0ABT1LAR8_9HYPH|nr:hypothetical protein [Alsobacter ponti]MCP8938048.1 hypothetical protein [Alsobacter ponti]
MIIVSHTIYLRNADGESPVSIDIHRPEKRGKVWSCQYDIDWPEGKRVFASAGYDALQALVLALQMIGAELYSSTYHQEGRLRAYENEKGYGFPIPSTLRDLAVGIDAI